MINHFIDLIGENISVFEVLKSCEPLTQKHLSQLKQSFFSSFCSFFIKIVHVGLFFSIWVFFKEAVNLQNSRGREEINPFI